MSELEYRSPRLRRSLRRWAIALLTVAAFDQIAVWTYKWYATTAFAHPPASPADAAVVLFSAFDSDGSLDAETRRRLEYGMRLYRLGTVRYLLCSGGARAGKRHRGADSMTIYLQAHGISPGNIYAENLSYDTWTNVEQSVALARRQGWVSLVFVSSPIHLPRTRFLARSVALPLEFSAYTASNSPLTAGVLEEIGQVHHEWLAWVAYGLLPRATHRAMLELWRQAAP